MKFNHMPVRHRAPVFSAVAAKVGEMIGRPVCHAEHEPPGERHSERMEIETRFGPANFSFDVCDSGIWVFIRFRDVERAVEGGLTYGMNQFSGKWNHHIPPRSSAGLQEFCKIAVDEVSQIIRPILPAPLA